MSKRGVPSPDIGKRETWIDALTTTAYLSEAMDMETARRLAMLLGAMMRNEPCPHVFGGNNTGAPR